MEELKQRHGCVTFWLWLIILTNILSVIIDIANIFNAPYREMSIIWGITGISSIINILSAILLMRWNKIGFYITLVNTFLLIIASLLLLGNNSTLSLISSIIIASIISTVFAFIFRGILQIKKNGISAWKLMEKGWDYKHCRHLYQVFTIIIFIVIIVTIIAITHQHPVKLASENNIKLKQHSEEIILKQDTTIVWNEYKDKSNSVSIKVPNDFRRLNESKDELMTLGCSDYDPYIAIVQEKSSNLKKLGITSSKEYAQLRLKIVQNSTTNDFKKLNQGDFGENSYFIEYEMMIDGVKYYYKVVFANTINNFYYCQIICDDLYKNKLKDQINILNFVIEKRYARISSSVILTIQIIETSDEYYVCIISTAANVLFDFGSINHFMNLILTVFKELGFEEV